MYNVLSLSADQSLILNGKSHGPTRALVVSGMQIENSGFKTLLRDAGFHSFLWTQFLGAFNDNLCKMVISLRAVHVAATTGSGSEYLALSGAIFVLPFLLFSGYSGRMADRLSK